MVSNWADIVTPKEAQTKTNAERYRYKVKWQNLKLCNK